MDGWPALAAGWKQADMRSQGAGSVATKKQADKSLSRSIYILCSYSVLATTLSCSIAEVA